MLARAIAAALALVMSAAGCGGAPGTEEVSVLVAGDPAELQAYRDVVAGFHAVQDEVTVNLIELTDRDELISRLSTSIAGGSPPDLFLMNYRYYGQFESKGALEPIEPYLAGSEALDRAAFYPRAMEAFQDNGEQTCLPQNVSSLVVYYNRDMFEAAGLAAPTAGWTWAEMVALATRLTVDDDGDGEIDRYGLGVDPELIRIAPFMWSNLGELTDDPEAPTRFTLGFVNDLQAMQAFFDLRTRHGVTPTDEEAEAEDFESRFVHGTLAMFMDSRKVVPTLRTIEGFEWDVAPLPQWVQPASILHSDAYCMTAGAAHKDDAWSFLEYALGPEGQRLAAETGRTVPSMRDVAESEVFLDPSKAPAASQVFLDNIEVARSVPHIATWPEIEDAANGLIEEGYYSGAEAAEVAAEIIALTAPMFERARA